jgi:ABC-type multidrug transport system permease subunit
MKQKDSALDKDDIRYWAVAMLIFIGIGIVVNIIIQIVFHILLSIVVAIKNTTAQEECTDKQIEKILSSEMVEDEMYQLISLKSMRISFVAVGFGFLAGLLSLAFNASTVVMLNIIFIAFFGGSLLEGFTQLYYFRRGIHHG